MKVLYEVRPCEHAVTLHFSRELPLFPRVRKLWWQMVCNLNRRTQVWRLAQRMARENRGRFVVELADPVRTYAEFLRDLLTLPGVDRIHGARRYSMRVEVGRAFDAKELARSVAQCVQRYFYPEDSLELEELPASDDDEATEIYRVMPS